MRGDQRRYPPLMHVHGNNVEIWLRSLDGNLAMPWMDIAW